MRAARKSRPECIASDKMPKLPVRATRKILSESRTTAEPTDASAARRFSREACWAGSKVIRQIIRRDVRLLGQRGSVNQWQTTRFAVEAADFDFVEQQRRSDNRAGNAALGRTKRAERGSGESAGRILHVRENGFVVTVCGNVAQRTQLQAFDVSAADHFFAAVGHINAIHHQRNSFAAGHTAGDGADKVAEILLAD